MNKNRAHDLKIKLEAFQRKFERTNEIRRDALEPVLKYTLWRDKELAAFLCSILAYGKVEHIKKSAHGILDVMGESPHAWLTLATERDMEKATRNWSHRFNGAKDMALMLTLLKKAYNRGSLESWACPKPGMSAAQAIENLVDGVSGFIPKNIRPKKSFWYFLPKPSSGSACKRMNLFLRWVVGKSKTDLGLWTQFSKKELIIPLDTHVMKQSLLLKLTKRKTADWKTAEEITQALRYLDPNDPTRFDFALCHMGIQKMEIKPTP